MRNKKAVWETACLIILQPFSYAGIIQIRFEGLFSAAFTDAGTPNDFFFSLFNEQLY
jgi:hypothetical protein